jgi:hypothetical protein
MLEATAKLPCQKGIERLLFRFFFHLLQLVSPPPFPVLKFRCRRPPSAIQQVSQCGWTEFLAFVPGPLPSQPKPATANSSGQSAAAAPAGCWPSSQRQSPFIATAAAAASVSAFGFLPPNQSQGKGKAKYGIGGQRHIREPPAERLTGPEAATDN